MRLDQLSVFIPCYNEAENIEDTVEKAVEVLKRLRLEWEIIIINDGSTDNTLEVSKTLTQKNPRVRIINQKNGGYGMAIRAGFRNARFDTIAYIDGDGQYDFSDIVKFIEKMKNENVELVTGYTIKRKDPFVRIIISKIYALIVRVFFGLRFKNINCGFKMIRRSVLEKINPLESTVGGIISAEIVIKAKKNGFRIAQVGVCHYQRKYGKQTGASAKVVIHSYIDLLKLRWKLR